MFILQGARADRHGSTVGRNLAERDPSPSRTHVDGRFNEFALAQAQELAPHDSREVGPSEHAHHEDEIADPQIPLRHAK
jgi:hypothetical protein